MTDVNKNIFEAYKSMYEEKETPEQCVRMVLKKEGGAAGLSAIQKGLKDKGHDVDAKEVISKMSDVKQHKEGDYILEDASNDKSDDGEGMDKVDPKAVKKKFKDRKDQDIDNDGDVDSSDEYLHKRRRAVSKAVSKEEVKYPHMMYSKDGKDEVSVKSPEEHDKYAKKGYVHDKPDVKESFTVDDIRAMCHSKDHDCATYVDHPEFGLGKPVYESHAIPNDDGSVDWYDVEFAHGIEREVPAEDMQILQTEAHKEKVHKDDEKMIKSQKKKMKEEDEEEEEPKMMDSDENPMKKKKKVMVPDADKPSEDDAEEDKPKVGMEKPEDKKKKKTSGNSGEKEAEISKIGEQVSEFTNLLNELMAVDAVGKKKKEKDGSEPDERDENNPEGEKDFVDAHGKKDVVVDGEKAIDDTSKTAKDTKQGKHVKQQQAKGDSKPIKSTEAPVKGEKEPKEGEGKKSVKTESTLMDMAVQALKGKTVPEMKNIIASKEKDRNPFDARTKDAKAFLERMAKRKNGDKGTSQQYVDKDPKDLPMIKGGK